MAQQNMIQGPSGTRDLYPIEAARRRYITEAWRRVSINHGFEEIDGPTFETTELYTKKSGEGIVSEIFGVFSGKDEAGVKALGEKLARGEDAPAPYALRPEFTPTLARMYAAKAASLPKPTKWFSVGPYFRAERPQRGRLREFLQWNCDVLGLPGDPTSEPARALARRESDADVIACVVELLLELGLKRTDFKVRINDRQAMSSVLSGCGIVESKHPPIYAFLDRVSKLSETEAKKQASELGVPPAVQGWFLGSFEGSSQSPSGWIAATKELFAQWERELLPLREAIEGRLSGRCDDDLVKTDVRIVRGLAYYTGMVFEITIDEERAVAGGGRYDNLIELFGGPPTPAIGFGMGDVVLSLVLQDKGLMPSNAELMGLAGQSPDVFVISGGDAEAEAQVPRVLAALRRGAPRGVGTGTGSALVGLHARRSYKTTKNVGKLLQDAVKANARFAVILESATACKVKDLASGVQEERSFTLDEVPAELRRRLGRG